jgi:hypothetical protein
MSCGPASCGLDVALVLRVSQRIIELLIGRLITDEAFRTDFLHAPERTLRAACAGGLEITATEIAALVGTDPRIWERTADAIDPRLQKARLTTKETIHV